MMRKGYQRHIIIAITISTLFSNTLVLMDNSNAPSSPIIAQEVQNSNFHHLNNELITDIFNDPLSDPSEGYTLYAPEYTKQTYLINNQKQIVHTWNSKRIQALGVYLLEDGNLIRTSFPTINNSIFTGGGASGRVEILDVQSNVIWEFEYSTNTHCMHHDIEILPNGNILISAWKLHNRTESNIAGRNPNTINNQLWSDYLIEIEPTGSSGGNIVWEWHAWDHLIQDYDPTKENYGIIHEHPELIDINFGGRGKDWNHINSIDYNEEFDQILLSSYGQSEIWIIDHNTTIEEAAGHNGGRYGMGGDLLYRWGNPQAYQLGNQSNQKLFIQHDATWIEEGYPGNGNILIFNNGIGRSDGDYSSVIEIVPPVNTNGIYHKNENMTFGPEDITWEFSGKNTSFVFFSSIISGAQRLPNGNTLICEGVNGYFFEVTPENEIIWDYQYTNPLRLNNVFKIHRYSKNYPGIKNFFLPSTPYMIYGKNKLGVGFQSTYSTSSYEPNGNDLYYKWDWGDGTDNGWLGPYKSDMDIHISHRWDNPGTYQIKVKSKNINNFESDWSESFFVQVQFVKATIIGNVNALSTNEDESLFLSEKLFLYSVSINSLEIHHQAISILVDNSFRGILTHNIVAGIFTIKNITEL